MLTVLSAPTDTRSRGSWEVTQMVTEFTGLESDISIGLTLAVTEVSVTNVLLY